MRCLIYNFRKLAINGWKFDIREQKWTDSFWNQRYKITLKQLQILLHNWVLLYRYTRILELFAIVPIPEYRGKSTGISSTQFLKIITVTIHYACSTHKSKLIKESKNRNLQIYWKKNSGPDTLKLPCSARKYRVATSALPFL